MSHFKVKMHPIRFLLGSAPNPAKGAYSASQGILLRGQRGGEGKGEGRGRKEPKGIGGKGEREGRKGVREGKWRGST